MYYKCRTFYLEGVYWTSGLEIWHIFKHHYNTSVESKSTQIINLLCEYLISWDIIIVVLIHEHAFASIAYLIALRALYKNLLVLR